MPRAFWFLPVVMLTLLIAVMAFRLGVSWGRLDESAVIKIYAELYVEDHIASGAAGIARPSDCLAVPGTDAGIWVILRCSPRGQDQQWDYYVNYGGGLAFTNQTPNT